MSRYNQYGYYEPAGSSQSHPTGYTYQTGSTAPAHLSGTASSSGYGANQQSYAGSNGYSGQSYGSGAQNNASTNHAAVALGSLGGQDYNQASGRSSTAQYDNSQWYGSNANANYGGSNLQPPKRSQANNPPLYASTQGSTFGRLGIPDQSQSTSGTHGASSSYQNAPSSVGTNHRYQSNTSHAAQNPPQSYNSPLDAVQAQQQDHQKQGSRGSTHQTSPLMANAVRYAQQGRQPSSSVEPSPTTVDPSQVYDNRAELERKARVDAERRKKIEAEQEAKEAEENRLAAEKRKVEEAKAKAAETAEATAKKEQQERETEQRRRAREEKRQSKSAATPLQQMSSVVSESSTGGAGDDDEAQMRAMFKKMREFNSKNPAMLAKLWEEERKQHSDSQSPQLEKTTSAPATKNAHSRQSAAQAQPKSTAHLTTVPGQVSAVQQAKKLVGSQASPQSTPSRPAPACSTNSLWPPHKKGALADATAKWLMGLPENAGKTISQQAVLNILNSNPSYVQLCESLENLDMKFERSTLAREILKAVPDGMRTQSKPSTPTVAGIPGSTQASKQTPRSSTSKPRAGSGSGTVSYATPLSLSDAAREVNEMHRSTSQTGGPVQPPQPSPYPSQIQTLANGSRPPSSARAISQSQPREVKPEMPLEQPPRAPIDKEGAARKRTFGDLVDLTKDDDSDEDGSPPKKTFQLPSSAAMPPNGASTQHRDPFAYLQGLHQPYQMFNFSSNNQAPDMGAMQPPQQPQQVTGSNDGRPGMQHQPPQQAPLKPKGPSAEQLQGSRMRGRMLVEPIMRDRVARKSRYDSSTIARDVLLATGRHPDMRGLNAHLNNMQKLLGHHGGEVDTTGTRCDLSTIRWDIIDPEQPKESEKTEAPEANAKLPSPSQDPLAAPAAPPTSSTFNHEAPFMSTVPLPPPEKKKRGRKPRAPMPVGESGSLGASARPPNANGTPTARVTSTSLNNTPRSPIDPALIDKANTMAAAGTPVGYSAFRTIGPDGQVIKKKGRPVGWKKSIHSREAQGLPPSYPKAPGGIKPVAQPRKDAAQEKPLVEPLWQSYRCEWQGCKAELQNLDTLKKHLLKVHGRVIENGRGYQCLWKGCGRQPGAGGGFQELVQWIGHVDEVHLQPVAWDLGDGPRGGALGGE